MNLTVRITTDNDAFREGLGGPGPELARILRGLAERIENGADDGSLFDSNGNKVGHFTLGGR